MTKVLWTPNKTLKENSHLNKFNTFLKQKKIFSSGLNFEKLWKWSISNNELFWSQAWDFMKISGKKGKIIKKKNSIFYNNKFFPDSKLNYAKNLLSKKGRSSKLGERSIGHIDPGAASSFIIIKSIYQSIKDMN